MTSFSRDNGAFLPKSQYSCLNFRSICFPFFTMCFSKLVSYPYAFLNIWRMVILVLVCYWRKLVGHCFFLNVNVTSVDLVSFILIFHLVAQASNRFMWCCRRVDVVMGWRTLWNALYKVDVTEETSGRHGWPMHRIRFLAVYPGKTPVQWPVTKRQTLNACPIISKNLNYASY